MASGKASTDGGPAAAPAQEQAPPNKEKKSPSKKKGDRSPSKAAKGDGTTFGAIAAAAAAGGGTKGNGGTPPPPVSSVISPPPPRHPSHLKLKLAAQAIVAARQGTLKTARVWDVVSPPPVNSLKGHFVPKPLTKFHRKRRISVEVHRAEPPMEDVETERRKEREEEERKKREAAEETKKKKGGKGGGASSSPSKSIRKSAGLMGLIRKSQVQPVDEYEQCFVRILVPANSKEAEVAKSATKKTLGGTKKTLGGTVHGIAATVRFATNHRKKDDESSVAASTKSTRGRGVGELDDSEHDGSASIAGFGLEDEDSLVDVNDGEEKPEWVAKYKLPLKAVSVDKRVQNVCVVTTSFNNVKQVRNVIFDTDRDAEDFHRLMDEQKGLETKRDKAKFKLALDGLNIRPKEKLILLIEIVSGWDLPAADFARNSSDPYVIARFDGKEVHRTKFIPKTLDPVWTVKTDSLFLFRVDAHKLFECFEGMTFEVKDYDQFGGNESLGYVAVRPKKLYEGKQERLIYKLRPKPGKRDRKKGYLAIRCRRATEHDKRFMSDLEAEKNKEKSATRKKLQGPQQTGGKGTVQSIMTKNSKIAKHGPDEGKKVYKARPGPDPKRPNETEWMTAETIQTEVMKPSQKWLDIGSGQLGRIFLEILGCDGLPNLDTGGFLGNKTDAFVSVVYEDCLAKTDVIDDSLAPRFLPWSQRAFIFHTMHSSSQIFVGCFDYDSGYGDDHDLIGRVSVDLTNFQPETEYLLTYQLFNTAQTTNRKAYGSVTLRLRIEVEDQRQVLLSNLNPPPEVYVNVKTSKDFHMARQTIEGKYNMHKYNMKTINSYIEELIAYTNILYYVYDGAENLLMWRGHFPLRVRIPRTKPDEDEAIDDDAGFAERYSRTVTIMLPIHSINAFLLGVLLVERPTLMPSFFFAGIAWLLLAVLGYRRNSPNPWDRCKTFRDFAEMLILGQSTKPPDSIAAYENAEKAKEFVEKWNKRLKDAEDAANAQYAKQMEEQEEYEKEQEEIGETDVDITSKSGGGPSFDPFKGILYPIQQYLAIICDWLRFTRNVVIWEESYFSFWLCVGSLVLSVAFVFVPWAFFVRWTSRLVVWALLGPHMILVDRLWYSKLKPPTEEERKQQEDLLTSQRREATEAAAMEARINRENAAKLRAMKKYMFGRYITKVPILKGDRSRDIPLPASEATPFKPKPVTMAELAMREAGRNRTRVSGQQLVGDMIPTLEAQRVTDAKKGEVVSNKRGLEEGSPAASLQGTDSNAAAYGKIGAILVGALVVTWYAVPLVVSSVRWVGHGGLFKAMRSVALGSFKGVSESLRRLFGALRPEGGKGDVDDFL